MVRRSHVDCEHARDRCQPPHHGLQLQSFRRQATREPRRRLYLLDLETEQLTQMIDWDDQTIDLSQRGGDRGLRGIAFGMTGCTSPRPTRSSSTTRLPPVGSIKTCTCADLPRDQRGRPSSFLGSVGYDTILEYDIAEARFSAGYASLSPAESRATATASRGTVPAAPDADRVRPERRRRPPKDDATHPSFPWSEDGSLYVAGGGLGHITIRDRRMRRFARIPFESHNAHPFRSRLLMNHPDPPHDVHRHAGSSGAWSSARCMTTIAEARERAPRPRLPGTAGIAEAGKNLIIPGSSPATINLFHWDSRADQVDQRHDERAKLGARPRDLAVCRSPPSPLAAPPAAPTPASRPDRVGASSRRGWSERASAACT